MRHPYAVGAVVLTVCLLSIAALAENPARPPAGPGPANADQKQQESQRQEKEDRGAVALNDAVAASNQADFSRAQYEQTHKAGPVTPESLVEFHQVEQRFEKAVNQPINSPEVAKIVAYSAVRFAGLYQYVGQFDKAVAMLKKADRQFAGLPQDVEIQYNLGLMYLQAIKDPKQALVWLHSARNQGGALLKNPDELAKMMTGIDECIQRADTENNALRLN